jgi:hypothetical protein
VATTAGGGDDVALAATRAGVGEKYMAGKLRVPDHSSPAFPAEKKVSEQEFRRPPHNHLTSINVDIERPDDGNVLITCQISDI